MKQMKFTKTKGLILFALFIVSAGRLWALDTTNVNSPLYQDINTWASAGILRNVPQMQPYPLPVVIKLLKEVLHSSYPTEVLKAKKYLSEISGMWNFSLGLDAIGILKAGQVNRNLQGNIDIEGNFNYNNVFAISVYNAIMFLQRQNRELANLSNDAIQLSDYQKDSQYWYAMPYGQVFPILEIENSKSDIKHLQVTMKTYLASMASFDWIYDNKYSFDPFKNPSKEEKLLSESMLKKQDKSAYNPWTIYGYRPLLYGVYLSAGISRLSFGPNFDNGVFFGGAAPQSANFQLFWQPTGWFSYTLDYSVLTATGINSISNQFYPNKQIIFHSAMFSPFPIWQIGLNDTVIYGGRFDLLYFVPYSYYYLSQGMENYPDNSVVGATTSLELPENIQLTGSVDMDDTYILSLHSWGKIALNASLSWTPLRWGIRKITLDYTAITPFTFTHVQGWSSLANLPLGQDIPDYQNGLTQGYPLGATLDPNSDRVRLKIQFEPLPELNRWVVNTNFYFMRHGNPNEGHPGFMQDNSKWGIIDGSYYDAGWHDGGYQFNASTPFLTQKLLQYVFQACLSTRYDVNLGYHNQMFIEIAYWLEKIWNYHFQKGSDQLNNYVIVRFGYYYHF